MDRIPIHNYDTEKLITESKTFCMMPWVHVHMTPEGVTMPCCISNFDHKDDIPKGLGIEGSINSEAMKQLRLNMLAGKPSDMCKTCYKSEQINGGQGDSFRKDSNERYKKYIRDVLDNTGMDGTLHNFQMRYYDIRFSNICNMKCRTCNAGYSSLWEAEDIKHGVRGDSVGSNTVPELVREIISHIPHMDHAYFAGGEPLITEDHYLILEEMIRQGRLDIQLVYNTNLSNLNFKNKDILSLWSKFDNVVQVFASLDHYGKRAEYIRSGTQWEKVEENIRKVRQADNVYFCITTTVSVMNYLTLDEFMQYFLDNDLWPNGAWQLNPIWHPPYFSPAAMPQDLKDQARERLHRMVEHSFDVLGDEQAGRSMMHVDAQNFHHIAESQQMWPEQQQDFLAEIARVDQIRSESFAETFPELRSMLYVE